jgi:Uma2 family endonuclease
MNPGSRVTVDQYHKLIEAGILGPDDKVELLEGVVVERFRKSPQHVYSTSTVTCAIDRLLPPDWHTRNHAPVTTADSEPEPDVFVARGEIRDYGERHPGPADVGLVVEVADQSLDVDRRLKGRIYARAGVPVYWVVNLPDRQVEVFSQPAPAMDPPTYRQSHTFDAAADVPVEIDGHVVGHIAVTDLLP